MHGRVTHNHGNGDNNHSDGKDHGHHHCNEQDQGVRAMLRYARFAREMWRSDVNEAVVGLIDPKPGEVVVDIGAGVGAGSVSAAKRGASVMAIEPTPYMRRILNARRTLARLRSTVTIINGAAEATGLPDNAAAAIWAVNTMHHWTDMDAAVIELARVVAPGGRVVLVDEDFEDETHPDFGKWGAGDNDHSHGFEMVDADTVAAGLRQAGLDVSRAGPGRIADRPATILEAAKPTP